MSTFTLAVFLVSTAIGSYFQALTGFALGIVVIAGTVALDVGTVPVVAVALSILSLSNVSVVLFKHLDDIDLIAAGWIMVGVIPGLMLGVMALNTLSVNFTNILYALAGCMIISAGIVTFIRPRPRTNPSSIGGFTLAGLISGVFGGLFSIAGPPLVYHYYRQPLPVQTIRATLLAIFATLSSARLIVVAVVSPQDLEGIKLGLVGIPVVILFSWLCIRFPPRISTLKIRRLTFGALILAGVFILLAKAPRILAM